MYWDKFDSIVIGLGGMGSATLYELAAVKGYKTLGIEQFSIPHEKGSSHGLSRIIRLAYFEHPSYIPLLKRAYYLWNKLQNECSENIFSQTGSIDASYPDDTVFAGSLESCRIYDLEHFIYDGKQLSEKFSGYNLPKNIYALFQPQGGFLNPELSITSYVKQAILNGAVVKENESVISIQRESTGMSVYTDKNVYKASNVIVTAGAWVGKLLPFLASINVAERQVIGWFECEDEPLFLPSRFPVFNMQVEEGKFYGFPSIDNKGFKIGKWHHRFEKINPDSLQPVTDALDESELRACVARYFPKANGKLLSAKVCMFTNTPDEHFIIDKHPKWPLVFACGFSGHGFKFCSVIGEILAQMVRQGKTNLDISWLSYKRFNI